MATIHELPDTAEDAQGLTLRQRRVLQVIRESVDARGYPPSVREIGEAVGLNSPSSVAHQLKVLQAKGFLRRDPNRPRAMEVLDPDALDVTGIGDQHPGSGHGARRRADRRRRPDPGRAGGRGRLPPAPRARRVTGSCSCCGCAATR